MTSPTAVGVHLFGGAFARGMLDAGFDVQASLEDSNYGESMFRLNLPDVRLIQSVDRWAQARELRPTVMFGNPSCSCWSAIGRGANRWKSHPDLEQTLTFAAVGLAFQPDIWVTESVPPFASRAAPVLAHLFMEAGYAVSLVRHDAKFIGLPQQRRRVFLVAHRVHINWQPPRFDGIVPVGMALEGVEYREEENVPHFPEYNWLLDRTPPGHQLSSYVDDTYPAKRRPRILEFRVPWDTVSGTLVGQPLYYHPYENRHISWREFAALCGYPDDWEADPSEHPGHQYGYLGKAVLPPVARWLGSQLLPALQNPRPPERDATLATFWASTRKENLNMKNDVEPWTDPYRDDWLNDRVREIRNVYNDWRL